MLNFDAKTQFKWNTPDRCPKCKGRILMVFAAAPARLLGLHCRNCETPFKFVATWKDDIAHVTLEDATYPQEEGPQSPPASES